MFNNLLASLNDFLYSYILIFLLVAAGIYFSIRTKFVQFRLIGDAIKALKEKAEKNDNGKSVSSFQALMISTASRVGTGNIAGIATAIVAGGPGAVFWMWVMAIVGGASAFVESTLAQVYKVKDGKEFRGGPSYYIERALGKRWLGVLFSILLIACFAYGFNGLQTYNMSSALEYCEQRYDWRKHLNGNNYLFSNTLLYVPKSGQHWFAGVDYSRENTRDKDNAYQRAGGRLGNTFIC